MKINIQHRHNRGERALDELIGARLAIIGQRRAIIEANVRVEENLQESPPCTVLMHLVTPGPDIVERASDHTLAAAVLKVEAKVHSCIDERERSRTRRGHGPSVRTVRGVEPGSLAAGY
jgi:hypothetical protein